MKLIVGLGNPGYEYQLTPHNMGFLAVDRLAELCGVELARREAQSLTASTELDGAGLVLAKPETFMNLSGLAVARLLSNYGLAPGELIVLVDDVDLPLGSLRIRGGGSAGRHNGLKSIIGALESDQFVRVRMGVGPHQTITDRVAYLLGRFRKADLEVVDELIGRTVDAVRVLVSEGVEKAMSRFNRRVEL